jgi:osmotically-inducible protein OsmY
MRRGWGRGLVLGCLLVSGCGRGDADRLARVARQAAAQLDGLSGGARDQLGEGLEAARGALRDGLAARVATRLRWDRDLAASAIEVQAGNGVVRLRGGVASQDLRQRAVELARSTVGAEQVVDEMTVQLAEKD